jgi:hypothetical protein
MRVHFRQYGVQVRELDKQIISAVLFSHYKTAVLALVTGGSSPEEADRRAITATDEYAKSAFPDLTIDVLPEADQ